MTSKRETIMAYFATRLATITVANGYNTTVTTVERVITPPEITETDFTDMPLVLLAEGSEAIDYEPSEMAMSEIGFTLYGYLKASGTTVSPTTLNAFIEDLRRLVAAESSANGNAVDTIVTAVDVSHASGLPYASAKVSVRTLYHHEVASP